jgi:hypothetical protein
MRPFSQPGYSPSIGREKAASFATDFMLKASRSIRGEVKDGPSTITRQTEHFERLVGMYHHCLAESLGPANYTQAKRREMNEFAESIVWTCLRAMTDQIAALRRRA